MRPLDDDAFWRSQGAAFRGAKQKCKDLKSWRCKECQQPPCTVCGERLAAPLAGGRALQGLAELRRYRCTACLAAHGKAPRG